MFTSPVITPEDHILGPADAPVTVVEYGDYECPYCRGAARDVHRLLERFPGLIRFVFRNFPIPQLHPHADLSWRERRGPIRRRSGVATAVAEVGLVHFTGDHSRGPHSRPG